MRVKLTRKLAEMVDGVDLSSVTEGDLMDLAPDAARLLLAEGWAVPAEKVRVPRRMQARADDRPRRKRGARP